MRSRTSMVACTSFLTAFLKCAFSESRHGWALLLSQLLFPSRPSCFPRHTIAAVPSFLSVSPFLLDKCLPKIFPPLRIVNYSPVADSPCTAFNVKNQMIKYLTSAFSTEILINCISSWGGGLFFCHFTSRKERWCFWRRVGRKGYSFAACKCKQVLFSFQ